MKNEKGFVNILLIAVAIVIIGGGTFYYVNNQESASKLDLEESSFIESSEEEIEKDEDLSNDIEIAFNDKDIDKKNNIINKSSYKGFWFYKNNPAVISDFTEYLINEDMEKLDIDLINDLYPGYRIVEMVSKTQDGLLLEIPSYMPDHGILSPSFFIYITRGNKIFGIEPAVATEEDVRNNIEYYVNEISTQPEKKVVYASKDFNENKDGYYFAEIISLDKNNFEISLDFLTPINNLDKLHTHDILLSKTDQIIAMANSYSLINNNKIIRKFRYSIRDNLGSGINDLEMSLEYRSPKKYLIKIENNVIVDLWRISYAS